MNIEIERKFLIKEIPLNLSDYPHKEIIQGYISTSPVIRLRKSGEQYYLTCKSKGLKSREEFEIQIQKNEFNHLIQKIDHSIIIKDRYYIPISNTLTIEFDVFKKQLDGLVIAEIEFSSLTEAENFTPLKWFDQEVTQDYRYQNNYLCQISSPRQLIT